MQGRGKERQSITRSVRDEPATVNQTASAAPSNVTAPGCNLQHTEGAIQMQPRHVTRISWLVALTLLSSILLVACGGTPATGTPADAGSGSGKVKIGFLYVGPTDDYGYNYAAEQGRLYLQKQLGDKVETLSAENVPEDANAERVMEQMINSGATIIFRSEERRVG